MQCDGFGERGVPDLLVIAGGRRVILRAGDGEVLIGRAAPATIRIADGRVSRLHIRLAPAATGWTVADYESTNGLYHQGQRITEREVTDTMTLHMSNPAGIPITLTCIPRPGCAEDRAGLTRAGRAVRERREALGLTHHDLHEDGVIVDTVLMSFECGAIWPTETDRARLEAALGWTTGAITAIRTEVASGAGETTENLTPATSSTLVDDQATADLRVLLSGIDALPIAESESFVPQASRLLHELRKLDVLTTGSALEHGQPMPALTVSAIRRTYTALLNRVAQASKATLGQRLAAARHHAGLSASEVAHACEVTLDVVVGVEAGLPVPEAAARALQRLVDQLSWATADARQL